mmetsp:Transcript_25325/g.4196  ORF Transcript_25325/g.4196 Transcript_25325/m.4196 type:complete len:154 (-) Transcript_25325:2739-3200(-)
MPRTNKPLFWSTLQTTYMIKLPAFIQRALNYRLCPPSLSSLTMRKEMIFISTLKALSEVPLAVLTHPPPIFLSIKLFILRQRTIKTWVLSLVFAFSMKASAAWPYTVPSAPLLLAVSAQYTSSAKRGKLLSLVIIFTIRPAEYFRGRVSSACP